MDKNINLDDQIPLKYQIRNYFKEKISEGLIASGDQIPTQKEIGEMFGVSRMTVVNALQLLESEGLIERHQGKGTFVKNDRINRDLIYRDGFTKDLEMMGYSTSSKIIFSDVISPTSRIVRELKISSNEQVIKLKRLRIVEGEPVGITTSYIKYEIGKELLNLEKKDISLYDYYEKITGKKPNTGAIYLEPILLNEKEAELLNTEEKKSGCLTTTTTLIDNKPVGFVHTILRGDKFRFVVQGFSYNKK